MNIQNHLLRLMQKTTCFPRKYMCSVCGNKIVGYQVGGEKSKLFETEYVIGGGRRKAFCPVCGASDRLRWINYVIQNYTDIYSGKNTVLHIAPEKLIESKIRKNKNCVYISGDLVEGVAEYIVDITDMKFENEKFNYIILNHVMEHVKEQDKAFEEIKRCLKRDGKLIFSVPICANRKTYEDSNIVTKKERIQYYGQEDHCRLYGEDIKQIMEKKGFNVTEIKVADTLSGNQIHEMNLIPEDRIYICKVS